MPTMKTLRPKILVACGCALLLIICASIVRANNYSYKVGNSLSYVSDSNPVPNSDSDTNTASSTNLDIPVVPADNQTDDMSQKLFANLMVLQSSGNLSDQSITDLATSMASQVDASNTIQYQVSDLTIINKATIAQTKDYANKFWAIRQKYVNVYKQNEIGSTNFSADPTDPSFSTGFAAVGDLYIKMAADLSKLPVPSALADLHLKLLNNYVASGLGLKKMNVVNSDPINAVSGLSTFSNYTDYETTILEIMAQYFSQDGIIFTSTDPGIGWNSV